MGDPYSQATKDTIQSVSKSLDLLMDSSMDLFILTGHDVRQKVRDINARLANDVIIMENKISDEEARDRLLSLGKEIFAVSGVFEEKNIPLKGLPSVEMDPFAQFNVDPAQVKRLLAERQPAVEMRSRVSERWLVARPEMVKLAHLPLVGTAFTMIISANDKRLEEIASEATQVSYMFNELEDDLRKAEPLHSTSMFLMRRNKWDRMRRWVASIQSAGEAMNRVEAFTFGKEAPLGLQAESRASAFETLAYIGGGFIGIIGIYLIGREVFK